MSRKSANTKANNPPIRTAEERETANQINGRDEMGGADTRVENEVGECGQKMMFSTETL